MLTRMENEAVVNDFVTIIWGDTGVKVEVYEDAGGFTTHYFSNIEEAKQFIEDMGML